MQFTVCHKDGRLLLERPDGEKASRADIITGLRVVGAKGKGLERYRVIGRFPRTLFIDHSPQCYLASDIWTGEQVLLMPGKIGSRAMRLAFSPMRQIELPARKRRIS